MRTVKIRLAVRKSTASVAIWTLAEVPGIVKAGRIDRLGGRFVNAKQPGLS